MRKIFLDKELTKNIRAITCPHCTNSFETTLSEMDTVCEECGEHISLEEISEDFIWHPSEKF